MNGKEAALVRRSEKRRAFTEDCYAKTKQGRFEKSIRAKLVYPDGRQMEISDGGRAMNRMIRSLDWAYHQARRERCIREQAARLKDSTLQRILWGIFKGRDQAEAIRLAKVSKRTFFRGVAKIKKGLGIRDWGLGKGGVEKYIQNRLKPIKTGKRGTSSKRGVAQKVRKSRF